MNSKITVLVPTTSLIERQILLRDIVLPSVIRQISREQLSIFLIVNHLETSYKNIVEPLTKMLNRNNLNNRISISCQEHRGSIFEKFFHVVTSVESEFICLLDDDIEIIDNKFFQNAMSRLVLDSNIAAVSAYIDVGQSKFSLSNRIKYGINRFFTLWGYQDSLMRVKNSFSRGQPLQSGTVISHAQWVPNNACIVRTSILRQRLEEMRHEVDSLTKVSNGILNSQNMWAVDLFMFLPIARAGQHLVYLTTSKALHWGHETAFGFFRRIKIETLWSYYYFIRFFRTGLLSIVPCYIWPNLGRFLQYLLMATSHNNFSVGLKALFTLGISYVSLINLLIRISGKSKKLRQSRAPAVQGQVFHAP